MSQRILQPGEIEALDRTAFPRIILPQPATRLRERAARLRHLAEVQVGVKGLDLLEQVVGQLLCRNHRQARDVVDQLVGIERTALAARLRQRIDGSHAQAQESQLEDLVEAHGPHADDQHIGGVCLI